MKKFNVVLVSEGSNKLQVVKAVKKLTHLGLKSAKEKIDHPPSNILKGVRMKDAIRAKKLLEFAGARVKVKPMVKSRFNVILVASGPNKLQALKTIKRLTGLGLKRAKYKLDNLPSIILRGVRIKDAIRAKMLLEDIGAKIKLKARRRVKVNKPPLVVEREIKDKPHPPKVILDNQIYGALSNASKCRHYQVNFYNKNKRVSKSARFDKSSCRYSVRNLPPGDYSVTLDFAGKAADGFVNAKPYPKAITIGWKDHKELNFKLK